MRDPSDPLDEVERAMAEAEELELSEHAEVNWRRILLNLAIWVVIAAVTIAFFHFVAR